MERSKLSHSPGPLWTPPSPSDLDSSLHVDPGVSEPAHVVRRLGESSPQDKGTCRKTWSRDGAGWGFSLAALPASDAHAPFSTLHPDARTQRFSRPLVPSTPSLLVPASTSGQEGRAATGLTVLQPSLSRGRGARGAEGAGIRGALGVGAAGGRPEGVA